MMSDLVKAQHLCRKAVIYIRQSSPHQVMSNQESLRLQYALCQRASALGWEAINIEVVDIDLGLSGATVTHREGFKDVIARVTLGEVGIILSYEVTRLARNCSDWYPLLDLCGYRQCLIGDRDGVYDPGSANGRLLLGLKGTISEVELHTLRGRLTAGLLSKAERGELALLPAGLERGSEGVVTKDASREVQERIVLVFAKFLELGSVGKVMRCFRDRALTVPRRDRFGDIVWRIPSASMLAGILKNPAYAGAFVYGRTRSCHASYASGKLITARRPMAEWKIVVKDRYPAYLDWLSFERVQAMLSEITRNTDETRRAAFLATGLRRFKASSGAGDAATKWGWSTRTAIVTFATSCNAARAGHCANICLPIRSMRRWWLLFSPRSGRPSWKPGRAPEMPDCRRQKPLIGRRRSRSNACAIKLFWPNGSTIASTPTTV